MSRDLEALLEAFHAIIEAPARQVEACEALYQARLEDASTRLKLSKETLHRMILRKHLPWLRANTKPSSLPPKA
jgi:hypothetical protein